MNRFEGINVPTEEQYLNCIRCGACLPVCPTYREALTETASPRGRIALARKTIHGELELSPGLMDQMYACLDCLACNEACPVGIRPADLALEMRHVQEQIKPSRWKEALFGKIVAKPRRLELSTWLLRVYERTGIRRLVYALGLKKSLSAQLRDLESMLPPLPERPLRPALPEITQPETRKHQVGFFLGCAQSLFFAEESSATLRVLARNGCQVFTPKETVCCGMPALSYGKVDLVQTQARHNIALFESSDLEAIITDCATCGSTLKDYGKLLAGDPEWAERAAQFSARVQDISEFLMKIPLEKPKGSIHAKVTYHDPCHLKRAQNVWREPRALLQMIDGLEFVELPEADWCCGSAGSQLITHYETSLKVLQRKTDNLTTTGATYIASGCPGCQMQLNVGINRAGLNVKVVHPITLLDLAYRQEKASQKTHIKPPEDELQNEV